MRRHLREFVQYLWQSNQFIYAFSMIVNRILFEVINNKKTTTVINNTDADNLVKIEFRQ